MTSRERTLIALRCGRPDRVPIQVFGTQGYTPELETYGENYRRLLAYAREKADMMYHWIEPLEQCWSGMYSAVPLQKLIENKNGTRIKTLLLDTPGGPLTQISESDGQTVSSLKLRKPFVETDRDFEKLMSIPFTPYRPQFDGYRQLRKKVNDRNVVSIVLPEPIAVAGLYLPPTEFILWTIEQKEKLHALLDKIRKNMEEYVGYLLAHQIGEVFWLSGAEDVVPPLGPPDNFDEFVAAYHKTIMDMIHGRGGLVILHCHGSIKKIIPKIRAGGYDALQPVEAPPMGDITMAEAKEVARGKMCLIGNIQVGNLYTSTPEKIEALCRETIEQAKPDGGFILGITASHFSASMDDRTLANYLAYIDAGRKYGNY